MPRRLLAALLLAALALPAPAAPGAGLSLRSGSRAVVQAEGQATVPFVLASSGGAERRVRITLRCTGGSVMPTAREATVGPGGMLTLAARVTIDPARSAADLVCAAGGVEARVRVLRGIDLTAAPWRRKPLGKGAPLDPALAAPDVDDSGWREFRAPALWDDLGYTPCRTRFAVPADWRHADLSLLLGAVDDGDVTYFNGVEIGRTDGWDLPRAYRVPAGLVRWGQANVLTVVVRNDNAGGGLSRAPLFLAPGGATMADLAAPGGPAPAPRPRPGRVGPALPLRPLHVTDGVLRYPDGAEVALWGTNYYAQSWVQYVSMRRLGVDMKAAIRHDLDDMQAMGVQVIRIHVFDREISDAAGNIVPNEHLDLLDYLVSECGRRGIYMFFTPIAWWGSPNGLPDAFSNRTTKPGMLFVPAAVDAACRYLGQFLTRRNPYTGRRYKDEPCLCLLEVQNEPAYFGYSDLEGDGYTGQGEPAAQIQGDRAAFRDRWRAWLASTGLDGSTASFGVFRYELMREYIRRTVGAIRAAGARQPVAISSFEGYSDDIAEAIGDSECDAITLSAYPGGWSRVNDDTDMLPQMAAAPVDARWSGKARLAYEFDAPATNTSRYLYPAIAANFRNKEVQVACQFQYDSLTTARWNLDWNAHWLNRQYTPAKAVSYMVAGEAFRRLPRAVAYAAPKGDLVIAPMVCSFAHNTSQLVTPDLVMYAAPPAGWAPLALPAAPKRIVGVGSSAYADYDGTGYYDLSPAGPDALTLDISPNWTLVGDSLHSDLQHPAAELDQTPHSFRLELPGWEGARCLHAADGAAVERVNGRWELAPGRYRIERR